MGKTSRWKMYISPIYLLIADIVWGMGFVAQKMASDVPAITMAAWRSAFATAFLLVAVLVGDRLRGGTRRLFLSPKRDGRLLDLTRHELIGGALCGAVLALATIFQQEGLNGGTDGGKAAFITALYVVFVPVIAQVFLRRRSPLHVWVSVIVSVVGFYLLCVTDSFTVAPSDLLVLICSLIFAVQILLIGEFSPKSDGLRMSLVQFFTMFVLTSVAALIADPIPSAELFLTHLPSILYLGFFSSGVAYTFQILGQRGTPPAVASVILSLESVVAAVGTAIVLEESMTPREMIGCTVVFLAVLLSELDLRAMLTRKRRRAENTVPTDAVGKE